jgi:hypothetical protein
MKWMKILFLTICLAVMLTVPIVSYADESQVPDQQTAVAPSDQSSDQLTPPAAPIPQDQGQSEEVGK